MMERFEVAHNDPDAEPTIACLIELDSSGFEPTSRHQTLAKSVLGDFLEVRELDTGYALRYPNTSASITTLAEWIAMERRCCNFLDFQIHIEPAEGPVWLSLSGGAGVKESLDQMLRQDSEPPSAPLALDKIQTPLAVAAVVPSAGQAGMVEPSV